VWYVRARARVCVHIYMMRGDRNRNGMATSAQYEKAQRKYGDYFLIYTEGLKNCQGQMTWPARYMSS